MNSRLVAHQLFAKRYALLGHFPRLSLVQFWRRSGTFAHFIVTQDVRVIQKRFIFVSQLAPHRIVRLCLRGVTLIQVDVLKTRVPPSHVRQNFVHQSRECNSLLVRQDLRH